MSPPPAVCTHTPGTVLRPTRSHPVAYPVTNDKPTISCRHAELIHGPWAAGDAQARRASSGRKARESWRCPAVVTRTSGRQRQSASR